jgi:hypothetical protein
MLKRVRWMGLGFGLGVGATVAAARKVRRRIDRYQPSAMVERATEGVQSLRDQLAAAIDEGRSAARDREAELRNRR